MRYSFVVALGICGAFAGSVPDALAAAKIPANVSAAVADTGRPDADRQRDAARKPAETLAFAGIKTGAVVAELLPGGGYYTRILSKAVGPQGHVYAVAPGRKADAAADAKDYSAGAKAIAADPAYANVSVVVQAVKDLSLPVKVDLVWTSQNYHDVHNVPDLDAVAFDKMVFDSLKPGGYFLVLDHAAASGSGVKDTSTLHRIDPDSVKKEALAAGFVSAGQSDVLKNSSDPHTAGVLDPSIRGKTDQFILKFRKPEKAQ